MNLYYFDTSALVKLYIAEQGSQWLDQLINQTNSSGEWIATIVFSKAAIIEAAAALARRKREGRITAAQQKMLLELFMKDVETRYKTIAISDRLVFDATDLTQAYPLRGYDAIHLATALQLNHSVRARGVPTITLVAADGVLLQAAAAENLLTENPNQHP